LKERKKKGTISRYFSLERGDIRMNAIVEKLEKSMLRTDIPVFKPGDTIKVHVRVKEGEKERTQLYEGIVIARRASGMRETITVRRNSYGIGVERVFPLNSAVVEKIDVLRRGRARRAKLFFLRELSGKKARIKEIK